MSTTKITNKLVRNRSKNKQNRLENIEKIAVYLDAITRRNLPDGVIQQGILQGCEAEIRQDALIMAVGGFLEGNHEFREAQVNRDDVAIANAMERCIAISLKITKRRLASRLSLIQTKECQLAQTNFGSIDHPSQCHPNNWPPDLKSRLIMQAVSQAVTCGKLSLGNASIVFLVCERGMAVKEVASTVRITRSAVYQQINRVRQVIPEVMESIEPHSL